MKVQSLWVVIGLMLGCAAAGVAQEGGDWRASNSSAKSTTGDVAFSGQKILIDFSSFTIAEIRTLKPDEMTAAFDADPAALGSGHLYRLDIPAEKRFLHKNTICGSDETQYVASYVSGRTLQLAFFSGASAPVLSVDALSNGGNLCGVFSYTR